MNKILVFLAVIFTVFLAGCIDGPPYVIMADLNNDGSPDIVITEYGTEARENTISVFMAGTNESFARELVKDDIGKNTTIIVDLNKDGNKDIVYGTYNGDHWKVLFGKGDGTFSNAKNVELEEMKRLVRPD